MESSTLESASLTTGQNQATIGFTEVQDSYQRNSNWWVVFACFDLQKCTHTVNGVVAATGFDFAEVEQALSGLCLLGYLHKNEDFYERVPGRNFLDFDYSSNSKAEIVDTHGLVSQQVLNDLGTCDRIAFDHRCFAGNDLILAELYKDLRAAFEKAFAKAQKSESNDRIFKMTFTAVDVLSQDAVRGSQI